MRHRAGVSMLAVCCWCVLPAAPCSLSFGCESVLVRRRLDLVDNTPVYDIKPYIPWDALDKASVRVPSWVSRAVIVARQSRGHAWPLLGPSRHDMFPPTPQVSADDELASVTWTDSARESIDTYVEQDRFAPLYKLTREQKRDPEARRTCVDGVTRAISEVVAQDPRAIDDGRGQPTDEVYTMTFSQLRVGFEIRSNGTAEVRGRCVVL